MNNIALAPLYTHNKHHKGLQMEKSVNQCRKLKLKTNIDKILSTHRISTKTLALITK